MKVEFGDRVRVVGRKKKLCNTVQWIEADGGRHYALLTERNFLAPGSRHLLVTRQR